MTAPSLRELQRADLDAVFRWESDPRAVALAAFTRADPDDRTAFEDYIDAVRRDPQNRLLAIVCDDVCVGTIGCFGSEGEREVTYWIDPDRWGEGIAGGALGAFLELETSRP